MPDDSKLVSEDARRAIRIRGARQNNLANLDVDIPTGELVVVTGVSGSGKSSLVFDTLYAEGQRRYVETFSPYARQFLDRMDRPAVDRVEGVPPAIAIDQTNPVRTSRSTVGTMTELNDHLKLLFARAAQLFCRRCAQPVRRDSTASIIASLAARAALAGDPRLTVTFPVRVPKNFGEDEVRAHLEAQGYTKVHAERALADAKVLDVVSDRFRFAGTERSRIADAIERALRLGGGRVDIHAQSEAEGPSETWRYSTDLHCADCDIHYETPHPSTFSFNSPLGACETCRGFGRVIGVDYGLVIPDERKTLREGAIKPFQSKSFIESQRDLEKCAAKDGIPLDVPFRDLSAEQREWVIGGGAGWKNWNKSWPGIWYGIKRFFAWLESKAYKMHIRVLLSRYRSYTPCPACMGSRLRPDATLWRVGAREEAEAAMPPQGRYARFRPVHASWSSEQLNSLPGLALHDLMLLPIERVKTFFDAIALPPPLDEATEMLLDELRARLAFLVDVGVGYLTLDRQSRTLSGGEVQRINLTTALGTSLVNTLFVLDEPSIGLHPRDMHRVVAVMHRLRDAGNSLVVVEHDPQVMLAADRVLDMGPGPGERGGRIVFNGTPTELRDAETLTGRYLGGRQAVDTFAAAARGRKRAQARAAGRTRTQPQGRQARNPAATTGLRDRRVGQRQINADPGRAVPGARQGKGEVGGVRPARSIGCSAATGSTASPSSTSRRSERQRAPIPPATSARSMRSARSSRSHGWPKNATTPPARSRSTPATDAARPAAAMASSTSRCSFCRMSTCAALTATASVSGRKRWKSPSKERAAAPASPTCST